VGYANVTCVQSTSVWAAEVQLSVVTGLGLIGSGSMATSLGLGSTGTLLMGTEAVGVRLLGTPVAGVCACGATSLFGEVTAGLGGARTGCGAMVRISSSTIWVVGSGLAGADAVSLLGAAFADPVRTGSIATSLGTGSTGVALVNVGWMGIRSGLTIAGTGCVVGVRSELVDAVGLLGAAFANPVQTGSIGMSQGMGLMGMGCR
jgi:hypothetical protein